MIRVTNADLRHLGIKAAPTRKRGMNRWESEYAQRLEMQRLAGDIVWWGYECIKIRLADRTFYTPDFCVWMSDGVIMLIEVKGFLRESARIRYNVAKELYPMFELVMVRKVEGKWTEI